MSDIEAKTISVVENPDAVVVAPPTIDAAVNKTAGANKSAAEDAAADLTRQLDALKGQAARDKAAREEAERRARAAEARVVHTESEAKSSNLTAIINAIDSRNGALATAQAALAKEWGEGDFQKAAETQTRIVALTGDLQRLAEAKDYAEANARAPTPQPVNQGPITDVDEFARVARLPPKSTAWLKDHPDALQRQKKLARAHDEAVEEAGFETPEYFSIIEKIMGYEKKSELSTEDAHDDQPVRAAPQQRRAPAAPPSSASSATRGRVEVRMTPEMRRAAEISGISEEKYAEMYLKAKREGQIS